MYWFAGITILCCLVISLSCLNKWKKGTFFISSTTQTHSKYLRVKSGNDLPAEFLLRNGFISNSGILLTSTQNKVWKECKIHFLGTKSIIKFSLSPKLWDFKVQFQKLRLFLKIPHNFSPSWNIWTLFVRKLLLFYPL